MVRGAGGADKGAPGFVGHHMVAGRKAEGLLVEVWHTSHRSKTRLGTLTVPQPQVIDGVLGSRHENGGGGSDSASDGGGERRELDQLKQEASSGRWRRKGGSALYGTDDSTDCWKVKHSWERMGKTWLLQFAESSRSFFLVHPVTQRKVEQTLELLRDLGVQSGTCARRGSQDNLEKIRHCFQRESDACCVTFDFFFVRDFLGPWVTHFCVCWSSRAGVAESFLPR